MPKYSVKDNESGRTVDFEWHGDQPPTEADLAEVFAASDAAAEQSVRDRPPSMAELDMGYGAGGMSEDDRVQVQREGRKQLPAVGGIIGGTFGPGGAGIGAGLGSLAMSQIDDGEISGGDVVEAGKTGAINAATQWGVGKAITAARPYVSDLLRRGAMRAMNASLKADRGYLAKMAGASRDGLRAKQNEISRTWLERNLNPHSEDDAFRLQEHLDETAASRNARIDRAPIAPTPGHARHVEGVMRRTERRAMQGTAPQDNMATVRALHDDVRTSPRLSEPKSQDVSIVDDVKTSPVLDAKGQPITHTIKRVVPGKEQVGLRDQNARELRETIEADNRTLRGMFHGNVKDAEVQSRLAVRAAHSRALDRAAGTAKDSEEMRRLIDARNVGNITRLRATKNNPLSITDVISLSAMNPVTTIGSYTMKPTPLANAALLMNRTGQSMTQSPSAIGELIRRALIAGTLNQP